MRTDDVVERRGRVGPHRVLAVIGTTIIVFIAPFEPNLALRYGPFVALFGFLVSGPLRFRIGWTEWALALFAIWSATGYLWTTVPEAYSVNVLTVLSVAVTFIGIRAVTRGGTGIRLYITAYTAGAVVGLIRTSSEFATPEATRDVLNRVTQVGDLNVNYVAYSSVAAVLLITLLWASGGVGSRGGKIVCTITLIGLTIAIAATQTRGAMVAVGLLVAWVLIATLGRPLKTVVATGIAVSVAVSTGWADSVLNFLDFGERGQMFGLSGRTELWTLARGVWGLHPIEGAGFGSVRQITKYNLPAHNTILEIGATLGLIGLLLFFAVVVGALLDRCSVLTARQRKFRVAAMVVTFAPVILSSTWELSAAAWVALALLSQPAVPQEERHLTRRRMMHWGSPATPVGPRAV